MAALRDAAEQAWLAQQQSATDDARAFLASVLDGYDVSTMTIADVIEGPVTVVVFASEDGVHLASRLVDGRRDVRYVTEDAPGRWVSRGEVTSLAQLHEVLPEPGPTVPPWEPGIAVNVGQEYAYNGKVYRVVQAHTTQADWTPDVTPALWTAVE